MPAPAWDTIVVGTGGIGSAALYHLAARGARVLGLDQFDIGHDKGSSHGDTRAIRLVYFEHPDYVPLLRRAFELWETLNGEAKTPVFQRTGILQSGPPEGEVLTGLVRAARAHDLPMEQLSAQEVRKRFRGFSIPDHEQAIYDPGGGFLRVEDCVRLHCRLARAEGASLQTGECVRHWYVTGKDVTVETDRNRYVARRLVITPGPWAPRLLPVFAPHLSLLRKSLFWFDPGDDCYTLDAGCPVFLFERGNRTFYGFPAVDDKGLKVAEHSGGRPVASPAELDRHVDTRELEDATLMVRSYLPLAGHQLSHHTTCMYTMTPDGHFIVGHYPEIPQVCVVAGLSGHGFKVASVRGEIMADLALEDATRHPIGFLSPERFAAPA
ncbi:MAG: N-methyl-L-tryptophan oxidase [Pseudomonadales bacterium]|nr:N-methyl-L-tryptophan oxidase [Pseudomonadales bacterium]